MKKIVTCLLISICSLTAFSQANYSISGRIIDAETKQPLQGASVFAENTTIGTATNNSGEFFLRLPNGGYSIVITFTGYQTETKRVTGGEAGNNEMVIEVKRKEKALDEFVVKSTFEVADGLEKYGDFFIDNFIGKTANSSQCNIKNKEVLKFFYYKRKKRLKILASEPLIIENNALGYTVKYDLDSFVHEYNSQVSIYTGYPLFQEMESSSIEQLLKWNAARKLAYNGSILHFMRSLFDKKLEAEKFEIQFIVKKNDKETAVPLKFFYGALNYSKDDSSNTVSIAPRENEVAVLYKDEEATDLYMRANPGASSKFQLSVLSFSPGEALDIEQNGFYYEQNDITISGYWAWEKVADMLPYDFKEKVTSGAQKTITRVPDPVKQPERINEPEVKEAATNEITAVDSAEVVVPVISDSGSPLTSRTWQMQESRVIDGNNMFYYQRGGQENTIDFDNDMYKFNSDNTGTYFFNGQQYKFNWKYLDAEKTKMEMVLQYPTPLIVNLENVSITPTALKYTRIQKVNGINYVAIETRTAQ